MSPKYYECHSITHSYHYTPKNNDLYYSLMSSNVTKYLTRASRSNTGTLQYRTFYETWSNIRNIRNVSRKDEFSTGYVFVLRD